jgi:hypothetical protein
MGFLKKVVAGKLGGDRPSVPAAAAAGVVAGVGAGVAVYKVLRSN